MLTGDFLRGRGRAELSEDELALLEAMIERVETVPARTLISRRGERLHNSTLLIDGFVCRYKDSRAGARQLLSYHVPGDFIDLSGFPTHGTDHDVATVNTATVAFIPHERLEVIMVERPHLARMLWFSTMLDAATYREWIFCIGRLDAVGRLSHFLCETYYRLLAVGRAKNGRFELPLTQLDLGGACGLTSVHINRVLRVLREEGVANISRGQAQILDIGRLARLGEFDRSYLYLEGGPWGLRARRR